MAPDQKSDSCRFLARSSLVRQQSLVEVRGPFPASAFGTGIPSFEVADWSKLINFSEEKLDLMFSLTEQVMVDRTFLYPQEIR